MSFRGRLLFDAQFSDFAIEKACLGNNPCDTLYMVGNVTTPENGIEQILKGFASIAGICERMERLTAQVTELRSEVAELRGSGMTSKAKPPEWLKLREVAERLNMSPKSVCSYIKRGLLRKNAISRHILILAEDVAALPKKVVL